MTTDEPDHVRHWEREVDRLEQTVTAIHAWLVDKFNAGLVSKPDMYSVDRAYYHVIARAGHIDPAADAITAGLMRHGIHAMRMRLMELFPGERAVISMLGGDSGQGR